MRKSISRTQLEGKAESDLGSDVGWARARGKVHAHQGRPAPLEEARVGRRLCAEDELDVGLRKRLLKVREDELVPLRLVRHGAVLVAVPGPRVGTVAERDCAR